MVPELGTPGVRKGRVPAVAPLDLIVDTNPGCAGSYGATGIRRGAKHWVRRIVDKQHGFVESIGESVAGNLSVELKGNAGLRDQRASGGWRTACAIQCNIPDELRYALAADRGR